MTRNERKTSYSLTERAEAEGTTPVALIVEAVERTGSMTDAAKELGISISTAQYHLYRAGLKPEVRRQTVISKITA